MNRLRSWVVVYAKGICMGAADAVPGVSGGTIALVTGIYERLISAITTVSLHRLLTLLGAVSPGEKRKRALQAASEMDVFFLLVLGSGIITAVITVTRLVDTALETMPVVTFGFFFGLIAASALVLVDDVHLDTPGRIAAAVTGFVLAFLVSGAANGVFGHRPLVTFLAGVVAVSALVLPGLSGSLLLILLGQYEFMVGALREAVDGLLAVALGGTALGLTAALITVITFVSGALIGLFTTSHVVQYALRHRREATLAFLVSLIVGALRAPVVDTGRRLAETNQTWTLELVGTFLAASVVGGVLVILVERSTSLGVGEIDGSAENDV